ncbi:MAG: thioredoxin family protein [Bacteroidales bacterium]|nr:thioredoxin family protein [Bacteroidales bacterium]
MKAAPQQTKLQAGPKAHSPALKKVYDENIDPLKQIDQAVSQAKREGKFVICQLGGNWCPWCLKFADFISKDHEISKLLRHNFVYIHVNYNPKQAKKDKAYEEKSKKLLKRLNNAGRFGYPVFVILNGKGKVIHIQDSSFLEEGDGYDRAKVLRFFKNWTPAALSKL